jgi:hypothetical protein
MKNRKNNAEGLLSLMLGVGASVNTSRPPRQKTLNVIKQGNLNKKCPVCGHKNKKCTCK